MRGILAWMREFSLTKIQRYVFLTADFVQYTLIYLKFPLAYLLVPEENLKIGPVI